MIRFFRNKYRDFYIKYEKEYGEKPTFTQFLLFEYERFMFYVGVSKGEAEKFLDVAKWVFGGAAFLKLFGISVSWVGIVWTCVFSIIFLFFSGIYLVRKGAVKYVNDLNNKNNPQLMDIYKNTKKE